MVFVLDLRSVEQLLDRGLRSCIGPDDRTVQGKTSLAVPDHGRLSLIRDSQSAQRGQRNVLGMQIGGDGGKAL